MDLKESVQSMAEKFSNTGDVKMLYGDPVEKNGKTIIPVASISYAVGGGGGKHKADLNSDNEGEGS